ncbi:hypothetical protein R5R35_002593 [Gryllus longicercus]|uniref:DNA primase n=1 Tax=Gryllus longicercus TaxID=2509291 RepID=A0AAN9VUE4_9ORTH
MSSFSEDSLTDMLPLYYKRLFPFEPYFRWLNYGNEKGYFVRREFSFTLVNDIYIRFKSFNDLDELEKDIYKERPVKIDIGAVYNLSPREKNHPNFSPSEKELVFDIDMTDYDDIRTCCSGADICDKCWKFMVVACKVLDAALREDFGFEHLLWVFSGRRGIHCWVCDAVARSLPDKARGAVAEYLQVVTGGVNMTKKVNIFGDQVHHSIQRAINITKKYFVNMCIEEQDVLGTSKGVTQFLGAVADDHLRDELQKELMKHTTSLDRWNAFLAHVTGLKEKGMLKKRNQNLVDEIMLQYTYPRLDINVSKGLNHLLKSPFCVHPKTGKICVPFNPKLVEKFSPLTVPVLSQLIEEINEHDSKNDDVKSVKDYKKTSIYKSVVIFETFVRGLEETFKKRPVSNSMEF